MTGEHIETVVIGAGVIGLAVGRALALAGQEVAVLECNDAIGMETSSRNSEVIHAGLYYPPGSLKAQCCVAGKQSLYQYCAERAIPHQRLGKLILARDDTEAEQLSALQQNARVNGVADLEFIGKERLAELEPQVRAECVLYSPTTGIIDSHTLMLALQADIENHGGHVATNTRVTGGYADRDGLQLQIVSGDESWLSARRVINAAGLAAGKVARSFPDLDEAWIPRIRYIKGHYFTYSGPAPFSHLVYPLPEQDGLGIHATLDQAGRVRFGPDAQRCATIDYTFEGMRKEPFVNSVRRWFPALEERRLQPGYTGIRPALAAPGEPFADFRISGPDEHGVQGLYSLFGIDSPGLTACLSLADVVRERCE